MKPAQPGQTISDDILHYIGALILRHIVQLVSNAHAVTELSSSDDDTVEQVRLKHGVFLVEHQTLCGPARVERYQAMVRSPGQVASLDPGLCSCWCSSLEEAKRRAADKALEFFGQMELLGRSRESPVLSANRAGIEAEQLTPQRASSDAELEGPWILLQTGPGAGQAQRQPYCTLCETWADDEHLTSTAHTRARDELQGVWGQSSGQAVERKSGEPEVMPFAQLHALDLTDPREKWPRSMRLLRLEPTFPTPGAAEYGLLLAAPPEEGNYSLYFGLSLEWRRGQEGYGAVRIQPQQVDWEDERLKARRGLRFTGPEELLRKFHEAMLHKHLPGIKPDAAHVVDRRPSAALLVKLAPDSVSGVSVRFAWSDMKAVVDEQHRRAVAELIENSTDECCEDGEAIAPAGGLLDEEEDQEAASGAAAVGSASRADDVLDLFAAPAATADEAIAAAAASDTPLWLMSVLHRWYRLHDLELASLKYGPVFPVLSPLAMEAALTMSCTGVVNMPFDALRALGSKVLGVLCAVMVHCRHPGSFHAQRRLL